MKKYLYPLFFALFLLPCIVHGQGIVVPGVSAATLAGKLVGTGVTILNPTLSCTTNAYGTFTGHTSLSFDSGIVLTNGQAGTMGTTIGAFGPASSFASTSVGTGGDPQLTALSGYPTYDACILQFDFRPTGDTVKFDYAFGSEEYGCCICSSVNDVFGFFISGPGYSTSTNLATVPGTTIPVCINSVNCSSGPACSAMGAGSPFCAYYINNSSGTTITYHGMTTTLRATAVVTPCDTYHLKIGVADGGDHILDAGVFLKAGSLNSTGTTILPLGLNPTDTVRGAQFAVRGCGAGKFVFTRPYAGSSPLVVHFTIGGTATNGYDYTMIADSITIPAYSATDTLIINPLTVTPAGMKTVKLYLLSIYSSGCGGLGSVTDSAQLRIFDSVSGIQGPSTACAGVPLPLTDTLSGGTWTSGSTSIATVGSGTGIVTGIATGTSIITYSFGTGCYTTKMITVALSPTAITGLSTVCTGYTITEGSTPPGGTWSCTNARATIGSSSGIVTGVASGRDTVIYTLSSGCQVTRVVTVNQTPGVIGGDPSVCVGFTTALTDTSLGGVWTSGSTSIATVGSTTGVVTGVATGTAVITYTLATGCFVTRTITVNPLPGGPIAGGSSVCAGSSITLSVAGGGGTWSSYLPSIAGVGSLSGVVTGVIAGVTTISYTLPTGCFVIMPLTVNTTPPPIAGLLSLCVAETTTLIEAPGGTWNSSAPTVATVGLTSGFVTAVSAGTALISYSYPTGCRATGTVTVNPNPLPITGSATVCSGLTDTLRDATPGGTWTSSDYGVAYVDAATGIVTGYSLGSAIITYTTSSGCYSTLMVAVSPAPSPIVGILNVCSGGGSTLYDGVSGGTWSSGTTSVVTINPSTGAYIGWAGGTSMITYSLGAGCITTVQVTVNPIPAPIGGTRRVCVGSSTTLTDATPGGVWSSVSSGVASIGSSSGIVLGVTSGITTISYSTGSGAGCAVTALVTVDPLTPAITGTMRACPGTTTTLSVAMGGGTWTSGATGIATIGSTSGVVLGVTTGVTMITYMMPTGCFSTALVTINPLPSPILGFSSVCIGASITLSDGTPGGTWSRSNSNVTVNSTSGLVTGVTFGTTVITYTLPTGCYVTKMVTVNTSPGLITGNLNVCLGGTSALSNPAVGGIWTSSLPSIATVGSSSGVVTGVTLGTSVISYSVGSGCLATAVVTVNALPAVIAGPGVVCAGSTITLTDATLGGTWSSGTTSVATIGSLTGIVTGVISGTSIITYTGSTGCSRTTMITVNTAPSPIGGPSAVCPLATILLTDGVTGGTWTSSVPTVATIGPGSGIVSGVATGTTTITYTLINGCRTSTTITVSPAPTPISGPTSVCAGSSVTLTDGIAGGSWSTSSAIVSVGSLSGSVAGVTAGVVTISYSLGSGGCTVTRPMTVSAAPAAIGGGTSMCIGTPLSLTDATTGGTWTSGTTSVATIGSLTGVVTGLVTGTTVITYTIGSTGCAAMTTITVNPTPTAITGPASVCADATIAEADGVPGGVWSSTSPTISIGTGSGIVTGVAGGTAIITYSIGSCRVTRTLTVGAAAPITGSTGLCIGGTSLLADLTTGGTWSSSVPAIATIGSVTGLVSGLSAGTTTITYLLPSGCYALVAVTVNTAPAPISGIARVCAGGITSLSDVIGGGTWTSGSTGIATVAPMSGVVSGVAGGTAVITYSLGTGCAVSTVVTVMPAPAAIAGPASVCAGSTVTLASSPGGGTWSSSLTTTATVGPSTGIVTGVAGGTVTIVYTLPTGCLVTRTETVNPVPGAISGTASVCVGGATALTSSTGGGTWTSASTGVATVLPTSGVVSGVATGTALIMYTLPTGCITTQMVTVNPIPSPIAGTAALCVGAMTVLTDAVTGGTWTSGSTTVATVGLTSGVVTGMAIGTSEITYTSGAGCSITRTVTVNPPPAAVTGSSLVCVGTSMTLGDASPGGTWISSNVLIATVGSATGIVTGVNTGTATITYTTGAGCYATSLITVNPPPPGITGVNRVCVGNTTTLSNTSPGGTWASSNTTLATVGGTGIVSGLVGGVVTITFQHSGIRSLEFT